MSFLELLFIVVYYQGALKADIAALKGELEASRSCRADLEMARERARKVSFSVVQLLVIVVNIRRYTQVV